MKAEFVQPGQFPKFRTGPPAAEHLMELNRALDDMKRYEVGQGFKIKPPAGTRVQAFQHAAFIYARRRNFKSRTRFFQGYLDVQRKTA